MILDKARKYISANMRRFAIVRPLSALERSAFTVIFICHEDVPCICPGRAFAAASRLIYLLEKRVYLRYATSRSMFKYLSGRPRPKKLHTAVDAEVYGLGDCRPLPC